jgi:WD40 repeat protein
VNLHAVYSSNVVSTTVTGTVGTGTVYVASTGCYGTANCTASLIPINTSTNTAGSAITISSPPNSMVVDLTGANVYFGTAAGLRILATSTGAFTGMNSVVGKVLAASPDGTKAIVSNTTGNPNVVYVVDSKASTSSPLLLNGVTAATFSPDSTTAYLLAGSTLYVYSTTRALQTISLPASASDAAFLATGTFGFVATPPSTVNLFDGCDNAAPQSPNTPTVTTASPPALLAALPDGKTMVAVTSPGFTSIAVTTSAAGCPPPVTATANKLQDLGQGPFTPKQVLVSSNGSRLFVISNLNTIMVYDFTSDSVRTISLSSGATPLRGALTLSGQYLYVGASDGTVHVLDAASDSPSDLQRIPVSLCSDTSAGCLPDLVAVRP